MDPPPVLVDESFLLVLKMSKDIPEMNFPACLLSYGAMMPFDYCQCYHFQFRHLAKINDSVRTLPILLLLRKTPGVDYGGD